MITLHAVPPLPYKYDALEPWIDEQTMRVHHEQHHGDLVCVLNDTEARLDALKTSDDLWLIQLLQQRAAKLACTHLLHCLFWETMGGNQGGRPTGELADQITEDFGSFAAFKARFSAAAASVQADGWTVLAWQPASQQLTILTVDGNALPAPWVSAAVLVLDVCEHAYYRKYEHRRAEYVHNWWNTVNWPRIAQLFAIATQPLALPLRINPHRRQVHDDQTVRTAMAPIAGVARHLLRAG